MQYDVSVTENTSSTGEPARSSLAAQATSAIRDLIINGELHPGDRLNETRLAADLDVSRNTLREAFRLLTNEGLITHEVHRGVQVSTPSIGSVVDLYKVRRLFEVGVLRDSLPRHPAGIAMRRAVDKAYLRREDGDWLGVARANLEFHQAIISLADSPRLSQWFETLSVEMSLVFRIIEDLEFLHSAYVELNDMIVTSVERGEPERASTELESYLLKSERLLLSAYVSQQH